MAVCLMNLIMVLVLLLSELKDEVATNDKTISSYDEWFNAKYGNWFDDEKYDEQHQKWRGKPKIIGGNNES
jgi:hypothetical protein